MTTRARWVLAAIAAAVGLVVVGRARGWTDHLEPAVQLARSVAAVLALGLAGSSDQAGCDVADATPRPRWRRQVSALLPALVALATAWAVLLMACRPGASPAVILGTSLEAGVLALAAVVGAGLVRERPGQPAPDAATGAAAGPVLVFLLAPHVPARVALISTTDPAVSTHGKCARGALAVRLPLVLCETAASRRPDDPADATAAHP